MGSRLCVCVCVCVFTVMSDLLYTFMGVDGSHVQAVLTQGQQGKGLAYSVRPCLDASSLELVDRLTPLW